MLAAHRGDVGGVAAWAPLSRPQPAPHGQALPEVSAAQEQTSRRLASRRDSAIIDIINIKPNKPFCALPRWESCLGEARAAARAGFTRAVVIATGAALVRHSPGTVATETQSHGLGWAGRPSGMAQALWMG